MTEKLRAAGELLGIPLVDNIIVTEEQYYSFKEQKDGSEDKEDCLLYTSKNNSVVQPQLVFQRKGSPVCPAVYLQDQYDLYMEQPDEERMNGVIENILLLYEQHEKEMAEVSKMPQKLVHYEDVKDNILFKLINTEYNQELLMQVPHIPYLDLSIVFYIYVSESEQGIMATLVHNEHIESWNVTVDELYEAARKNTPERMPARFCSIVELLFGLGEELEENPTI